MENIAKAATEEKPVRKSKIRRQRRQFPKQQVDEKVERAPEGKPAGGTPVEPPAKSKPQRSQPKALSTESSKLQNDPLWIEFEVDDFGELTPYRGRDTYAIIAEGFIPLVEHVYQGIATMHKIFRKRNISMSCFVGIVPNSCIPDYVDYEI